jgi:fucokinase
MVKFPFRVNWDGGCSDTPPYCNEYDGIVLNAATLLSGETPVEVTLEQIDERKIVFDSRDMDVYGEFDSIEPLQAMGEKTQYANVILKKRSILIY